MPKLNLDIFSGADTPASPEHRNDRQEQRPSVPPNSVSKREPQRESPRFVPVGFHQIHLRLLDKAVLKLREQGHWQANKSAIIRSLIEQNAARLESAYLTSKENQKQASSVAEKQG